ncbi:MAG TPA: hypothetical protein VF375_03785 [Candidatus Limnocylindrales bacterium]
MTDPALLAALAAVCGGLLAISGRDSRIVVGGLLVAMVAAPLAASPEPSALTIAFRVIGALLAVYILWMAARTQSIASDGSGIGIASEALIAGAAFAVGWFVAPVKPLAGPVAAQAAGFSLAALAVVPLAGRNVMRAGAAAAILVLSLSLLFMAWIGTMPALGQMVFMILLVGILGATNLLSSAEAPAPEAEGVPLEATDPTAQAAEPTPPADTAGPSTEDEPAADEADNAGTTTEPEAAPDKAAVTLRTSRSRSPRTIRKTAPVAPAETAAPDAVEAPATPPTTRVRSIRPREPRR